MKPKLLLCLLLLASFLFAASATGTLAADPYCTPGDPKSGINTALGCISTDATGGPGSFFSTLITVSVGLGDGVFIVTTSAGIPDKLKEGSEIITSAVTGLLFIILSVFLLRLIGINILALPGLR
jgi:hypothetical protein